MPRDQVDPDPDQTCSYGLHVCSWSYLGSPSPPKLPTPANLAALREAEASAACQVCARHRPGNTVIGFPAHGTRKRAVDAHPA